MEDFWFWIYYGDNFASLKGTPLFMSPQILAGLVPPFEADYTLKTDIYSLGVLLYKLIFNKFPFNGVSIRGLMYNIKNKSLEIPDFPPISN